MPKYAFAALLLATASAGAAAQGSVEISGIVDAALVALDRGNGWEKLQQSGNLSGSRLRFVGTEDLGGGLRAHFVLEHGFFIDTGVANAPSFYRRSIVSLSGSLGRLDFGRDYNPLFSVLVRMDPMGAGTLSSATGFQASAGAQANNAIFYTTPQLGGFSAKLMLALGESAVAPKSNGNRQGLNAFYEAGPVTVVAAYGRQETAVGTATTTTKDEQGLLGLNYKLGGVTLVGMHQVGKNNSGVATYNANNGVAFARKYSTSLVGATVPAGPQTNIAVTYQMYDDKTAADRDAASLGLAVFHRLSKRTTLYATATKLNNSNGGRFTLVDSGRNSYNFTPAAGITVDPKGMAAGIRHLF